MSTDCAELVLFMRNRDWPDDALSVRSFMPPKPILMRTKPLVVSAGTATVPVCWLLISVPALHW